MTIPRILPIAVAALALAAAAATPAVANYLPTNGRWAGHTDSTGLGADGSTAAMPQDVLLTIGNRRVTRARFSVLVACTNDMGDTYDRYFTGGSSFPRSAAFNSRNVLSTQFDETDRSALGTGRVVAKVDFSGTTPKFRVNIVSTGHETTENCHSTWVIPLRPMLR